MDETLLEYLRRTQASGGCGHNIIDSVLEYCKYIGDKL